MQIKLNQNWEAAAAYQRRLRVLNQNYQRLCLAYYLFYAKPAACRAQHQMLHAICVHTVHASSLHTYLIVIEFSVDADRHATASFLSQSTHHKCAVKHAKHSDFDGHVTCVVCVCAHT